MVVQKPHPTCHVVQMRTRVLPPVSAMRLRRSGSRQRRGSGGLCGYSGGVRCHHIEVAKIGPVF